MTIQWKDGHILWVGGNIAHHADCCCPGDPCDFCNGLTPLEFDVTIPSGHWGAGTCAIDDCNDAVGTFRLNQRVAGPSVCYWRYDFPSSTCWDWVRLYLSSVGGHRLWVQVAAVTHNVNWMKTWTAGALDCVMGPTSIPFTSGNGSPVTCTWDGIGNASAVGGEAAVTVESV